MKKASILSRIFARLVDTYLIIFLSLILIFTIVNLEEDSLVLSIIISVTILLTGVISLLFKDIFGGRSIGKRIFNLVVLELDGSVPSRKKLINRNFSSWFWPKDVSKLLFSADRRKQGDINNGTDVYQFENTKSLARKVLKIVISMSIIGLLVVNGFMMMIKQDNSYKTAITYIEKDQRIQEVVGKNLNFGYFPSGSVSRSNGYGEANFKIKVTGDKAIRSVYIMLIKEPNREWNVTKINF